MTGLVIFGLLVNSVCSFLGALALVLSMDYMTSLRWPGPLTRFRVTTSLVPKCDSATRFACPARKLAMVPKEPGGTDSAGQSNNLRSSRLISRPCASGLAVATTVVICTVGLTFSSTARRNEVM